MASRKTSTTSVLKVLCSRLRAVCESKNRSELASAIGIMELLSAELEESFPVLKLFRRRLLEIKDIDDAYLRRQRVITNLLKEACRFPGPPENPA